MRIKKNFHSHPNLSILCLQFDVYAADFQDKISFDYIIKLIRFPKNSRKFCKKISPVFFISQPEILVTELELEDGNSFSDSKMLPLTKVQRCWYFFLLLHLIESPFIWQWRAQMGTRLYNPSLFR